jgi:hypothetical protein
VPRADLSGDRDRLVSLEGGEARAHGGHADRAGAERVVRDSEDERAVDATRVTDEHRSHLAEKSAQARELRVRVGGFRGGRGRRRKGRPGRR